jgi:hypothetical protein
MAMSNNQRVPFDIHNKTGPKMDGNGLYMCNMPKMDHFLNPFPLAKITTCAFRGSSPSWDRFICDRRLEIMGIVIKGNHPLLWPSDSEDSGEREVL